MKKNNKHKQKVQKEADDSDEVEQTIKEEVSEQLGLLRLKLKEQEKKQKRRSKTKRKEKIKKKQRKCEKES